MPVELAKISTYLGRYLRISEIPDDPRAVNGLQLDTGGSVTKVGAAVDACEATIELARAAGADLMLVHHGLFWSGLEPIAGPHGRRIRALINQKISLFSAHLPLDSHPDVGNNPVLARKLGVADLEPFGKANGVWIGVAGNLAIGRGELVSRIGKELGAAPRVIPAGPAKVSRVGIITGAGSSELGAAARAGLDTFITGEGPHHTYLQAEELGINLIYAGHYATETVGVKALAAHISEHFGIPWQFLDHPTGM